MARLLFVAVFLSASLGANAQEIPSGAWLTNMQANMPALMCEQTQYFTTCFEVTPAQCNEILSEQTEVCIERYRNQIPETLVLPADGARWGQVLGGCAGGAFERQLMKQKVQSAKCNDPSQWM